MYPFLLGIVAAKGTTSPTEFVSLSGTSGSPIVVSYLASGGAQARVSWCFAGADVPSVSIVKGEVQKAGYDDGGIANYISVNEGSDWVIPHDFQNGPYYIRGTLDDGAPWTGPPTAGTWTAITNGVSNVFFQWVATGPTETRAGTVKVEISTDISGTPIVATGYYRGIATNEP